MATPQPDSDEQRVRDLFTEALSCVGKARTVAERHVQAAPSESAEARRWGYLLEAAEAAEEDLRAFALDIAGATSAGKTANTTFAGGDPNA